MLGGVRTLREEEPRSMRGLVWGVAPSCFLIVQTGICCKFFNFLDPSSYVLPAFPIFFFNLFLNRRQTLHYPWKLQPFLKIYNRATVFWLTDFRKLFKILDPLIV